LGGAGNQLGGYQFSNDQVGLPGGGGGASGERERGILQQEETLHDIGQALAGIIADMNRQRSPGEIERILNDHLDVLSWVHEKAEAMDADVYALSHLLGTQTFH
jgi:hypothetical protein